VPTIPADLDLLVVPFGVAGLIWGAASDRISSRWPAHEDGSRRGVDWRSVVVVVFAVFALAAVPIRFGDVGQRLLFTVFLGACVLLMATDLDQRLMPDQVTLPLILLGAVALAWGGDSLVSRSPAWLAVLGAVAIPGLLLLGSLPFGEGAFGGGDVKFLAAAGLVGGALRLVLAVFVGTLLSAVVILTLLAARRITLKSYIPFGPFLIAGVVWAMLLPSSS
jgi:leader peptidase (prepilin peptidase)/N-methyltransferase